MSRQDERNRRRSAFCRPIGIVQERFDRQRRVADVEVASGTRANHRAAISHDVWGCATVARATDISLRRLQTRASKEAPHAPISRKSTAGSASSTRRESWLGVTRKRKSTSFAGECRLGSSVSDSRVPPYVGTEPPKPLSQTGQEIKGGKIDGQMMETEAIVRLHPFALSCLLRFPHLRNQSAHLGDKYQPLETKTQPPGSRRRLCS